MSRDVEVLNPEREVHRVDVFERWWKGEQMCEQK